MSGDDQHEKRGFHLEGANIILDKPKSQEEIDRIIRETKDDQYKDSQIKSNRRLTLLNLFLVIGTLVGSGIGIWQASISRIAADAAKSAATTASETLKEMKTGSGASDTHTLAQQAVVQATQTSNLVIATNKQALQTETLAKNAVAQAKATNELAGAALRSAGASEASNQQSANFFKRQTRPWVGMDSEYKIQDLSKENKKLTLKLTYKVKNFGLSPASNTIIYFGQVIRNDPGLSEVETKIEDTCKSAERDALPLKVGDLLLPGAEKSDTWTWGTGDADKSHWQGSFQLPGCVVYRDIDGAVHHTRLCYFINLRTSQVFPNTGTCRFQSAD